MGFHYLTPEGPEDEDALNYDYHRDNCCPAKDETDLWLCTRTATHTGQHVASDSTGRICYRWPQEEPS